MPNNYLIIDVSSVTYRAFYSLGTMEYAGRPTGTLFGFFRELLKLKEKFNPDTIVFAFDSDRSNRRKILPGYKAKRDEVESVRPEVGKQLIKEYHQQVKWLRDSYLPKVGYCNVLCAPGFEADDLIARVAIDAHADGHSCVIVSGDHDLYQLLRDETVVIYQPLKKVVYTAKKLREEFGVQPTDWAYVKAAAGCKSDCVPGIPGIGIKYAAKAVAGRLRPIDKRVQQKVMGGKEIIEKNMPLVRLPLDGTPPCPVKEDQFDMEMWVALMKHLGLESLLPIKMGGGLR